MWKPGQSGNPSGVSKAYLETTRQMAAQPVQPSPGAERTRRWRQRKQRGQVVVSLDVSADLMEKLIRRGWLDAAKRGDKKAIAATIVEVVERAI
jgi:hypothetical protein